MNDNKKEIKPKIETNEQKLLLITKLIIEANKKIEDTANSKQK